MQRTRFRNKFLKNTTDQSKLIYKKQRNFCVSLLRKEKKEYCAKPNEKDITDKRKFGIPLNFSFRIKSIL